MLPLERGEVGFPILKDREGLKGVIQDIYSAIKELPSALILEKFGELTNIQGIALVGSSASGKSTLMKRIRLDLASCKDIAIPTRCITRPHRLGDDTVENKFLSHEEFQSQVDSGDIPIHWVRKMEGRRTECYGFEVTDPQRLAVYSANNDFFRRIQDANESLEKNSDSKQINKRIATLSKTMLILGVYAPDVVRRSRLYERSPDLTTSEKEYRIGDSSDGIIPYCHVLINNHGDTESNSLMDVVNLVKSVAVLRVKWGEIRDLGNHRVQFSSRLFDIMNHEVLFSDGVVKTFEYVERSPGVRTLVSDGEAILVTKEWREELGKWDIRLPGGKLFENVNDYKSFKEKKLDSSDVIREARNAAHKETLEEAGMNLNIDEFELEHISKCGASVHWDLFYFSVRVDKRVSERRSVVTSENEMILNLWLSYAEVEKLCLTGTVSEDRTSNFLLKFLQNSQKGGASK